MVFFDMLKSVEPVSTRPFSTYYTAVDTSAIALALTICW